MTNPFLTKKTAPHETFPFEQLKNEHYLPALEAGIQQGKADIEAITSNPAAANFENTITALDNSGEILELLSNIFFMGNKNNGIASFINFSKYGHDFQGCFAIKISCRLIC